MRNSRDRAKNAIILAIFSLIFLIVFAIICPRAKAEPYIYLLPAKLNRKAIDINKPSDPRYRQTCASAALANAVTFSINGTIEDAKELFMFFSTASELKATNPIFLWDKWMDLGKDEKGPQTYNNITMQLRNSIASGFGAIIIGMLEAEWVVIAHLTNPSQDIGHVVTVYGYKVDDNGKLFLYVTDSDDKKIQLFTSEVTRTKNGDFLSTPTGKKLLIHGYTAVKVAK